MDCYYTNRCKKQREGGCDPPTCLKLIKVDCLYNKTLLSKKQRYKTTLFPEANGTDELEFQFLAAATDQIENWVAQGSNLYLYSAIPGNGKTSWAVRFIQEYINKIWHKSDLACKALFISVPMYLIELKNSISKESEYINHIKENVRDTDLVVWDDIATKGATEFEGENLLNIIDYRINQGKANIFTSNVQPNELSELLGPRLASRIINTSTNIEFRGQDKRGTRH